MKRHRMPDMKEGGVNVTPLIDIVMCMIIFFMLVAKIGVATGADAEIVPPATLIGQEIEDMGNTLTLNVRKPEDVIENPTPSEREQPYVTALTETGTEPRHIPVVNMLSDGRRDQPLRRVLSEAVEQNPNLRIIILADQDVPYFLLEQVLINCSEAKVKDFNFQLRKGDSEAETLAGATTTVQQQ